MPQPDQPVSPHLAVPLTLPVEVAEISEDGLLLKSPGPVEPGHRCRLRLLLGSEPLAAELTICRCTPPPSSGGRYTIAAVFAALSEPDRQQLRRFLECKGA